MKKLFLALTALALLFSLAGCGEKENLPPPTSNTPAAESGEVPSQAEQPSDNGSAGDGQADDFVKYTPAESKIYVGEDVLVFEYTDAAVASFIERTNAGEEMSIVFGLPQFEAYLEHYAGNDGLSAQYNNMTGGQNALSNAASPDYKIDWSLSGSTVQLACKAHGYDTSALLAQPQGSLDVQIRAAGGETLVIDGGLLEKVSISTEVPEQFAKPLSIENAYALDSFALMKYATPKTEDYYVSGDDDSITVISYDAQGDVIYSESIYYDEGGSNSTWEQDGAGVKVHPDNSKLVVAWATHEPGSYGSKADAFYWPWSASIQQKSYEVADMWYFSIPTLKSTQMGKR